VFATLAHCDFHVEELLVTRRSCILESNTDRTTCRQLTQGFF
jgi:hypothetical protein